MPLINKAHVYTFVSTPLLTFVASKADQYIFLMIQLTYTNVFFLVFCIFLLFI